MGMTSTEISSFLTGYQDRCARIVEEMIDDPVLGRYVDASLPVPEPFVGAGPIRLLILGQDPTVDKKATRQKISTVLMLNQNGTLRRFVEKICVALKLNMQNVYATNVVKNFFNQRPNNNKEVNLLGLASAFWRPFLLEELAALKNATVISLGEPLLKILIHPGNPQEMRYYWGHDPKWRSGKVRDLHFIAASQSTLSRDIFPVIHQPCRQKYYLDRFEAYMAFICKNLTKGAT